MSIGWSFIGVGFQKGAFMRNMVCLYIVQKAYCLRLALSQLLQFTLEHLKGNKKHKSEGD